MSAPWQWYGLAVGRPNPGRERKSYLGCLALNCMFRAPKLKAGDSCRRITARKTAKPTHLLRRPALMFVAAGFRRLAAAGRMCHHEHLFQLTHDARRELAKVAAGVVLYSLSVSI